VKKAQGKQILGNTAYTMGGMLLMNGVLQLAVYPLLNAQMGTGGAGQRIVYHGSGQHPVPFCRTGAEYQPTGGETHLPGEQRGLRPAFDSVCRHRRNYCHSGFRFLPPGMGDCAADAAPYSDDCVSLLR
jgi:hypothetical protein